MEMHFLWAPSTCGTHQLCQALGKIDGEARVWNEMGCNYLKYITKYPFIFIHRYRIKPNLSM